MKTIFTILLLMILGGVVHSQNLEPHKLWEVEAFGKNDPSKELVERRDAYSKHFANEDGTVTAHIATGPLNYFEEGEWKTIYHTISPTTDGFENIYNSFKTYYPRTSSGNITTLLNNGSSFKDMVDMRMYYEVNGNIVQSQNISDKQGNINFNKLTYSGVYGVGIDLRLTQNTTQRKMDYIIQNLDALNDIPANAQFLVFEETAELPLGWVAILSDNVIVLRDNNGKAQVRYEKPIFTDVMQEGVDKDPFFEGTYELTQIDNKVVIKTKVAMDWLLSEERAFPVVIDPTATCYPDNVIYYDGRIYTDGCSLTGTGNASPGEWLYQGILSSGSWYTQSVWVQYNTSSICDGATISNVNMTTTVSSKAGAAGSTVTVRYRKLTNAPYTASNATRLSEIRGGAEYNNVGTAFSSAGAKTHTLGGTANTDLQSQLGADWFAVGYHLSAVSTSGCVSNYAIFYRHSAAEKPYISVTYTDPAAATATLTSQTTSICHGNSVTLSGNVTASGAWTLTLSDGTQVTGTGNSSWSTTVTPTASTTYSLSSLSVPCPTPILSGTAVITLPSPSGVLATNGQSATCVVNAGQTIHFYHTPSGNYIASITAGASGLGSTTATTYVDGAVQLVPACSNAAYETAVMQRHWVITPTSNQSATVRLPYTATELSSLATASTTSSSPDDLVTTQPTVVLSKYSGPANVNASATDNCPALGGNGGTTVHSNSGTGSTPVAGVTALYSNFSIPGFSEFWLHGNTVTTPLSVNLLNFSADCNHQTDNVTWSTTSEKNASHFDLERSRDGQNWEIVKTVQASGNSTTLKTYGVHDPVFYSSTGYYRLKQVDFDGAEEIYGPIAVNCASSDNTLLVFPNPSNGEFGVEIHSSEVLENASVAVYDNTGKQLLRSELNNTLKGTNMVYFSDSKLAPGSYLVVVESDTKHTLKPVKLVIQ